MLKEENDRLNELVVTDPDEWGRTFERIKVEIQNTKVGHSLLFSQTRKNENS